MVRKWFQNHTRRQYSNLWKGGARETAAQDCVGYLAGRAQGVAGSVGGEGAAVAVWSDRPPAGASAGGTEVTAGKAWSGSDWQAMAGAEGLGMDRIGEAGQARLATAWHRSVRTGVESRGTERNGLWIVQGR